MALYKLGVIQPRFPFVGVEILTTFWFLCHNFGSRYARFVEIYKNKHMCLLFLKLKIFWITASYILSLIFRRL